MAGVRVGLDAAVHLPGGFTDHEQQHPHRASSDTESSWQKQSSLHWQDSQLSGFSRSHWGSIGVSSRNMS